MTDNRPYTDEILQLAYDADFAEWSKEEHHGHTPPVEDSVKAILDAVAPLLIRRAKAEALREAAADLRPKRYYDGPEDWDSAEWLEQRADAVEAGVK